MIRKKEDALPYKNITHDLGKDLIILSELNIPYFKDYEFVKCVYLYKIKNL